MCYVCNGAAKLNRKPDEAGADSALFTRLGKTTAAFIPDGIGDGKPPLPDDALIVTPDEAGDSVGAAPGNPLLTVGAPATIATIQTNGDQDFFQVNLVAGQTYEIGMYGLAGGPNAVPIADAFVELYAADGTTLIVSADGGANTPVNDVNSGFDVLLTFTAQTSGTHYVNARAFDNDPTDGTTGEGVGDYELFARLQDPNDPNIYTPYYDVDSPLYAIDWGSQINKINQSVRNPDGNEGTRDTGNAPGTVPANEFNITDKNVVTIYFAKLGELYVDSDPTTPGSTDTIVAKGIEAFEVESFLNALAAYERVADIVYRVVDGVYDPLTQRAAADLTIVTYNGTPGTGLLGRHSPPDEDSEGQGEYNALGPGWNAQGLAPGGFSFVTILHELGHAHGLAHPHDNGGKSGVMRGVEAEGVAFDYTTGDFALNQAVYTVMSYEDGWPQSPYGNASTSAGFGYQTGLSAFDIAVIQDKYGVNESFATGNDTYVLADANAKAVFDASGNLVTRATGYETIWDGGGTDGISYGGTRDTDIDLRPATLQYELGGGGRVSFAFGVFAGYTIANGVTIENASSGSGNDVLTGNAAANVLASGAGNDRLNGGAGNDVLAPGIGVDHVTGGTGMDMLDYSTATGAIYVHIAGNRVYETATTTGTVGSVAGVTPDLVYEIEGAIGSQFGDRFYGDAGNNVFAPGAGNDLVYGGAGRDAADYSGAQGAVVVDLNARTARETGVTAGTVAPGAAAVTIDYLYDTEDVTGSAFGDRLYGSAIGNTLSGGDGNDLLYAFAGDDTLLGGGGADSLSAGDGNDVLNGGAGNDILIGGAGQDDFLFDGLTGGYDRITDFVAGLDDLHFLASAFGVTAGGTANLIVNGAASGTSAFLYNSGNGLFSFDADGAGSGSAVVLANIGTGLALTVADIVFYA